MNICRIGIPGSYLEPVVVFIVACKEIILVGGIGLAVIAVTYRRSYYLAVIGCSINYNIYRVCLADCREDTLVNGLALRIDIKDISSP